MIWIPIAGTSTVAVCFSYIDFAANNRLYARGLGLCVEIDDTVHASMVRDRKAAHTQVFGFGNKVRNAAQTIKQAILGVNVKVGKH